jgi:hypothetical protein
MKYQQAKAIGMDKLLAALGFQPAFQKPNGELWYKSPWRPNEEEPSFHLTPSRRGWKDFGNGERGGNILDFVMLYYSLGNNLSAALSKLDDIMGPQPVLFTQGRPATPRPAPTPARTPQSEPPAEARSRSDLKITKVQVIAHPALIGYLNTRGITGQFARQHLKEIHFTQHGKNYFALGFENDQGGYELRNPYYQGSTPPKDITSIELARIGFNEESITVFEGFFDYLSALVTHTITAQTPAIVLNTAAMKERAKTAILKSRPASVHLYLDHDDTGIALVKYFQQALPGLQVIDKSGLYDGYKDFNKMLEEQQTQKRSQSR